MPQDIKSIFIKVDTKEEFEELLQSGSVRDTQIAFILDTKQIWTHNTYFSCPYSAEEIDENEYVIAQALNDLRSDLTDIADNKTDKISSSTDNAVVRFDGTSGDIQNSGVTINDSDHLIAAKLITSGGTSSQFVKGDGSLDSNTYAGSATASGPANKAVSIPFGQVDSTSTSTAFTATVDGITELRDGVCVYLRNGKVTSAANCTLNVNGLGAKPMYYTMAATTAVSNQWNVNYTMLFIYNSTRVSGGCWDMYWGYYSDTNDLAYRFRALNAGRIAYNTVKANILLLSKGNKYLLAVNDSGSSTANKTLTTESFDPFGQMWIYSNGNVNVAPEGTISSSYLFNQTGQHDARKSFNISTTEFEVSKDVYLVAIPQSDGTAKLHSSPITQTLPITEDGLIYIYIGIANAGYQFDLYLKHPIYYYKNGAINLWTGTGTQTDVSKSTESNVVDVGGYDLMKINEVKGKSLVMNQWAAAFDNTWTGGNCTATLSDNVFTLVPTSNGRISVYEPYTSAKSVDSTHKYYCTVSLKANAEITRSVIFSYRRKDFGNGAGYSTDIGTSWTRKSIIANANTTTAGTTSATCIAIPNCTTSDEISIKNYFIVDLTKMFGAGNEPTTVEEVEAILGNDYYEYNTGEVVGNNVEKLDVTGFNMLGLTGRTEYATAKYPTSKWDFLSEDVVIKGMAANAYISSGTIDSYSISKESVTVKTSTSGNASSYGLGFPVRVTPNTSYYFTNTVPTGVTTSITWFDNDYYYISYNFSIKGQTFTSPANAHWCVIIFRPNAVDTEATFTNPVFNISNASKNGTYEPYKHSEFPLNLTELTGKVNGEGTSVTIFPDGLHGVGTAYDNLIVDEDGYARRAIKRMGSRAYASGDESDTSVITDNTNTYYPLAIPIEYVLDTPVQCVAKVYPNGTVKQVPVMPDSTPMVMDATYLHDDGGMIGGLMNRLASLEARIAALEGG